MSDDVTLGELSRRLQRHEDTTQRELDTIKRSYVSVEVYRLGQEATAKQFSDQGSEIAELKRSEQELEGAKTASHRELHGRIDNERTARLQQLEEARKEKAKTWVAVGLAALGLVLGIISGVVVFQLNNLIGVP
jgi:hypothetical protein